MSRPKLLDLYCCQGGASAGYVTAGFDVYGVDIEPQPRYPHPFRKDDALDSLERLIAGDQVAFVGTDGQGELLNLSDFDAMHASPPCQLYSKTHRIMHGNFPDLIGPTRGLLRKTGVPYVIENVMDAADELLDPAMLCGAMFGLRTYRHRLFETNWGLVAPTHPEHVAKTTKMGRAVKGDQFMHVVGNFSGVDLAREIMGAPWMNRDGLRESIPPAYAAHVGSQLGAMVDRLGVA